MKLSNEVKIGMLVAASFLIFFFGFYFLKGADIFSGENEYYVYYDNVQGLKQSAAVQVKGMNVGRVLSIDYNNGKQVKVQLAVSKNVNVPVGTTAELTSVNIIEPRVIKLNLGTGTDLVEDGAELPSAVQTGMLDNISSELAPLIQEVRHVASSLDTVLIGVSGILNERTANDISSIIASLDVTMKNLSQLADQLNGESKNLASIIQNTNSITSNLAANNQNITNIIQNAEATTKQLANAPIESTVKDLQKTISDLQGVVHKLNGTQGSLGMMVNDKELYTNLTQTMESLNKLIEDINNHPSRYINVTIFGKKKKD